MIQVDQVTKRFEGRADVTALHEVSLTIPRGEICRSSGPSGSGKSTLLNLIGGLDRPTRARSVSTASRSAAVGRRADDGAPRQDRVHLPVLQSAADADLPRKRRPASPPARVAAQEGRRSARASCSTLVQLEDRLSHLPGGTVGRSAAAGGHRPRPVDLSARFCWPTSPPATSTRGPARRSSRSFTTFSRGSAPRW